jgi:hypothetical protein
MHQHGFSLWDAGRGVFASASVAGAANGNQAMTYASSAVAVALFVLPALIKLRGDWRKADVQQDQAEAESWGAEIRKAVIKASEWEGKFNVLQAENELLKARIGQLAASQNQVTKAVRVEQEKRKAIEDRVGEVEKVQGSSSNLSLPATPETAVDLPQIDQ